MPKSFTGSDLESLVKGETLKGFPPDLVAGAIRKLFLVQKAADLKDLRTNRGNRF